MLADLATRIEAAGGPARSRCPASGPRCSNTAREGPAPLVRPAAALVPRPARAGQPAYNIPAALRVKGRWTARRWRAPGRDRAAPRGAAHDVRRAGGRAGAGDRAGEPGVVPVVDLSALRRAARGSVPARRGGGRTAVRPAHGPLLRGCWCASARGPRPAHHAPHRQRRLVDGHPGARARGALPGLRRGPAVAPAGAAGAVRGLRGLAAGLAVGEVLERSSTTGAAARRRCRRSWSCRPTARGRGAELPRRTGPVCAVGRAQRRTARRWRRHEGATLFMVLLAAFQVLLARYSGQDDSRWARRSPAATGWRPRG